MGRSMNDTRYAMRRFAEKSVETLQRFAKGAVTLGFFIIMIAAALWLHGAAIPSYIVWCVLFAPVALLVPTWTVLRGDAQTRTGFLKPALSFSERIRNGCFFLAILLFTLDFIYLAEFLFLSDNASTCVGCGAVRDFVP